MSMGVLAPHHPMPPNEINTIVQMAYSNLLALKGKTKDTSLNVCVK